jgi:transcriptional regulator with XRE-family HTH domain
VYKERVESCGQRIAKALDIRGMKQSELCRLAKVPKSSLSLYLSGAYEPKSDRIYLIAQALRVSEAWLMGYDVPMTEDKKNNTHDKKTLTEGEEILLDLFNQVPEESQQMVLEMIRIALKKK